MNDSQARGMVLRRLYDIRHQADLADPSNFDELRLDFKFLANIVEQLAQKNLVSWKPVKSGSSEGYLTFVARITAYGVDVVEGNVKPPIAIAIDNSVKIQGSQNVQIGGRGNVQTLTMDIEKMTAMIDSANASLTEKEEAKSLLKRISENKLVQFVLAKIIAGSP